MHVCMHINIYKPKVRSIYLEILPAIIYSGEAVPAYIHINEYINYSQLKQTGWEQTHRQIEINVFWGRIQRIWTGSNWAPAKISKHLLKFPAEPTMFELRLLFEPRKFFKFVLRAENSWIMDIEINAWSRSVVNLQINLIFSRIRSRGILRSTNNRTEILKSKIKRLSVFCEQFNSDKKSRDRGFGYPPQKFPAQRIFELDLYVGRNFNRWKKSYLRI